MIFLARYEASQLPTGYIETEHLLLGLLREDVLLRIKLKGPLDALRQEIERAIPTTGQVIPTHGDLPLSQDAMRALARAAQEAEELKHDSIDTGHLVLAVFAMKGKAAEALGHEGIDYEGYREALTAPREHSAPNPPDDTALRETVAPSLREAVSKLDQLVAETYAFLSGVNEEFAQQRLKRNPWTRKEALGHLIDWGTTHHDWFACALIESRLSASGYPEDAWVSAQHYVEVPWIQLVQLWASLNRLLAHVLSRIPEEKLKTPCRIGIEEPITLQDLIARYVERCEDILAQIWTLG